MDIAICSLREYAFTWESIVFNRHIRLARGNTRTKLWIVLGLILAQILSLALPLAGLNN